MQNEINVLWVHLCWIEKVLSLWIGTLLSKTEGFNRRLLQLSVIRLRGKVGLIRLPVTQKIAGSSPVGVANKRNNLSLVAETIGEIMLEIGSHYPNIISISLQIWPLFYK